MPESVVYRCLGNESAHTMIATVQGAEVIVMRFGSTHHWLVRRDGRDIAEGYAGDQLTARAEAENAATEETTGS